MVSAAKANDAVVGAPESTVRRLPSPSRTASINQLPTMGYTILNSKRGSEVSPDGHEITILRARVTAMGISSLERKIWFFTD